jgi:YD repeat-containing protein
MTSCTLPNNGGTTTFTYGADGLRRSKTTNGVTTQYAHDNPMLIREMQTNPTAGQLQPSTTYFEGPEGPAWQERRRLPRI